MSNNLETDAYGAHPYSAPHYFSSLASVLVVVSAMLFSYGKVWTQRIGRHPPFPEYSDLINSALAALVVYCIILKIVISYREFKKINWQSVLVYFLLLMIALFYYKTQSIGIDFLLSGLIGLALWKERPYLLIKTTFFSYLTLFVIQLCGYALGIFQDSAVWERPGEETVVRLDIGFGYPTYVFTYFLPVLLGLYYLQYIRYEKLLAFTCCGLLIFIYLTTDTRAALYMPALMLFNPLIEKSLKRWKLARGFALFAYPIFTLFSLLITVGAEYVQPLGHFLSGRLWFWNEYLKGGIALLGPTSENKIRYASQIPLDNQLFLHLFIGGLVTYVAIGIMHIKLTKSALNSGDYRLVIVIINTLEFGLSEANFSLGIIIFMPLLFSIFLQEKPLLSRPGSFTSRESETPTMLF